MADRDRHLGKAIVVRLPPELDEALRQRALEEDRTINSVVRRALRRELGVEYVYGRKEVADRNGDAEHDDTIDTILEVLHDG